ncbi:ABC transporter substrate-binding protein [Hydrogenoanaerobacterium sp.]|uniref:ABC transporter substrate-binding protein n=1 Tax=Hydrogenoanaerobacterium sp. TaxID=2953763 RepID=UPI00289B41A2|nr:ABC transporter substrate-binding protein [Hydrogenoanaerobacterium sp.]
MKSKRILAIVLSAILMIGSLVGCGNNAPSSTGTANESNASTAGENPAAAGDEGKVYFFNFKPEQDEAYQAIAAEYTEKTGVPVKVVTAAAGTYEQQLRSEIAKKDAPTIFQINGPVGYASWKQYTADLSGSEIYKHLADKSLAITEGDGVYGIPFAIEGYGIIVNNKIMQAYFAMSGAKATSLESINTFAKLKEVVEDMQAKKAELGLDGVFASTSLMPGEDWRWQTHLSNVPLYYEFQSSGADLSDPAATAKISFQYNEKFKNIFDLYLNNSTVAPTMTGSKSVNDSMAEFALGKAAMVQNGNWAYGQISGVEGNVVSAEDVRFLPIYVGMDSESNQGLCIGTENFFCINKNASEADQKASLDFLNWLYTSEEGKAHVTKDLGFIAPFDSFTDKDKPADPLGQQVMEWSANSNIKNVPWNFTIYPSQQFKDEFGSNLLLYAQGQMEWKAVVDAMVSSWAAEKAATAQ